FWSVTQRSVDQQRRGGAQRERAYAVPVVQIPNHRGRDGKGRRAHQLRDPPGEIRIVRTHILGPEPAHLFAARAFELVRRRRKELDGVRNWSDWPRVEQDER